MNYTIYQEDTLKKLKETELEILKYFVRICDENHIDYYMYAGSLLGTIRHQGFIPWDDDIDVMMFRKDYEKFVEAFEKKKSEQFYLVSTENEKDYFLYIPKLMMRGTRFKEWWGDQADFESGIYIDIFILEGLPEKRFRQKMHILKTRILMRMVSIAQLKFKGYPKRIQLVVNLLHGLFRAIHLSPNYLKQKTIKVLKKYDAKNSKQCYCVSTVPYPPFFGKDDFIPGKKGTFEGMTVRIPNNYDRLLQIFYGDYMKLPPESERKNHRTSEINFGTYGEKNEFTGDYTGIQ